MIALSVASGDLEQGAPELFDGIRTGDLEVRLARGWADVDRSQALRYRIFYEEMAALPTQTMRNRRRDFDRFDPLCDHLLVLDRAKGISEVVGTYRLLRRTVADRHGGFYSSDEYDIGPLLDEPGELLELGRSCVDPSYRTRATMQLLWRGIAAYVFHHDITLMFGCASLPGNDPDEIAMPLAYLYHNHLAPKGLRPRALVERWVSMDRLTPGAFDPRAAFEQLPPLIKGYLRLGGVVGDGAVIDPQFNTTDVCIVVRTDKVTGKYYRHYARENGLHPVDDGDADLV